jgi:hypothetical protein
MSTEITWNQGFHGAAFIGNAQRYKIVIAKNQKTEDYAENKWGWVVADILDNGTVLRSGSAASVDDAKHDVELAVFGLLDED